ncbi:hypothetical protein G8770_03240 [Aestuariicella hydrocarbonica]|uniref:Uncharacterized protein n=1 Tax=Pseudomaricurvus hydrocarbonicus TaxID=1470433 RepID=A0A9E5JSG1_9GAMM|nr:hypothetical protein [Aestuariicella hydrocarbonica]NHO64561.1 hypothetical protein [Aestuariicella hydrocarbonica]
MSDAISLFSITTESVRDNLYFKILEWLTHCEANVSEKTMQPYSQLPWQPSQESHVFNWQGSYKSWVDILRSEDQVVQVVLNLRYPKKRWFSQHKKDWKSIKETAVDLFGEGQSFDLNDRESRLHSNQHLKVLIKSYEEGRHAFIELKVARGEFCS